MTSIVVYISFEADCLARVPQNVNSEIIRLQLQVLSRNRSSAIVLNTDISTSTNLSLHIHLSRFLYLTIDFCAVLYNILV